MRITDVRRKPGLGDYTGDVKGGFNFRITDRWNNTVPGGGSTAATEVDVPFPCPSTARRPSIRALARPAR